MSDEFKHAIQKVQDLIDCMEMESIANASATPRTDELFAKRHTLDVVAPWTLCMKLEIELNEANRSIEASTDTFIELRAELERWRELPAKVEGLISQTNIPLSAAVVRTTALNQVLDLISTAKGGEA